MIRLSAGRLPTDHWKGRPGPVTFETVAVNPKNLAVCFQKLTLVRERQAQKSEISGPGFLHGDGYARFKDCRWCKTGLVTVLRRSPVSLCHLGFECERADAAQI